MEGEVFHRTHMLLRWERFRTPAPRINKIHLKGESKNTELIQTGLVFSDAGCWHVTFQR